MIAACNSGNDDAGNPEGVARGAIGVAECDDYLEKHERCVNDEVPAAHRGELLQAIASARASWKQAATNASSRRALADGCARALEVAKDVMAEYHCSW